VPIVNITVIIIIYITVIVFFNFYVAIYVTSISSREMPCTWTLQSI